MPGLGLLLVLLSPPEATHELAYRYEVGLVSEDRTQRSFKLTLFAGRRMVRNHVETDSILRRTVLALDEEGRPAKERVEVERSVRRILESPDQPPGAQEGPAHGKTFVWRREGDRWGLFLGEREVTGEYAALAERLRSWRDARLPERPVKAGESWEVTAARFLEAVGQPVPPGVEGRATFTLDAVDSGVATISFSFLMEYREGGCRFSGIQEGVWRFDLVRGRDLELEMKGRLDVDGGRGGDGVLSMTRRVSYPDPGGGSR